MERWQKPETESPCSASAACEDHPPRSSLDYNTPLRSVRGNATNSPSPFYKLSSELSRESLRIPGAVPFMWEQSPGRRKIPSSNATKPPIGQPQPGLSKFSTDSIDSDPVKPTLAILFRQPSLTCQAMGSAIAPPLAAPSVPQIAPPPAIHRARSSSARYSVMQQNTPTSSFAKNADTFADAVSDSASDVLTATAGCVSVDDSLMLSGPLKPPTTPSDARDFIMHRFLPAAHTIACESPQPPSRRFLPLVSNSVGPVPQTPSRCNGSFRDYGMAPASPSLCTYYSGMTPARRQQLLKESFHADNNGINQSSKEDDEEEEPPSTPKACGIFPFRIQISLHIGGSNKRTSSSAKHPPTNIQQHNKKSSKPRDSSHAPKRIMDILQEDQSSSYEDESPVHYYQSQHLGSERDPNRITAVKQTAIHSFNPRHLHSSDPYPSNGCSLPNQNVAMQRLPSDLNHEEASEHGSFYDAPSRFCSPSPAAHHFVNARASRASMYTSTLVGNPQGTRSSILGFIDNNPHSALLRGTERHVENSLCNYNMHISACTKPPSYHPCNAPPSFLTPQPSQESSSHESNISKGDNLDQYWETFSNANQSQEKPRIINNALFEDDGQENQKPCVIHPGMLSAANCVAHLSGGISITQENEAQARDAALQVHSNGNSHANNSAASLSDCEHLAAAKNGDHDVGGEDLQRNHHEGNADDQHNCKRDTSKESKVCNCLNYKCNGNHCVVGNGCYGVYYAHNGIHCEANRGEHYVCKDVHYTQKGVPYAANSGQHNACNGVHYAQNGNPCVSNGGQHKGRNCIHYLQHGNCGLHAWQSAHYVCDQCGGNGEVHNVMHGDWREAKVGVSSKLAYPTLPKSPTHSWLDRAMPLLVSANKSPNTSSRYIAAVPAGAENGHRKTHQASGVADSKWEALVKGTHFQPGHLRSEELFHQFCIVSSAS